MMKTIKRATIILLTMASILMMCVGIIGLNANNVLADEPEVISPEVISVDKASVYIDDAGIRYLVTIDKSTFDGLTASDEIGVYLAPTANLGANELNKDTYVKTGVFLLEHFSINAEERYQAYFYVYGIPAENNGDDISVRAYIKQGENYTLSTTKSCSIAKVAFYASKIDEENAETILNRYCVGYLDLDYTVNYKCGEVTVKSVIKTCKYGTTPSAIEAGRFLSDDKVNYSMSGKVFESALIDENCEFNIQCTEIDPITYADSVYTFKGSDQVESATYYEFINTTPSKGFEVVATFTPNGVNTNDSISGTGMSFAVKQGEHMINFLMVTDTGFYCVVDGEDYKNKEGWNAVKVPGATGAKIIATTSPVTLKMTYDSSVGFMFYSKSGANWVAMNTAFTLSKVNELCSVDYFDNNVGLESGLGTRVGKGGAYGSVLSYGGTVSNYTYTKLVSYTLNMACGEQIIETREFTGRVGDTVTAPSICQNNGVVYNLVGEASLVLGNESNVLNANYVKNFAVADLGWNENIQLSADIDGFAASTVYYTTTRYLKVNAGDKLIFGNGTPTIIATYSSANKSFINSVYTGGTGAASKEFMQDCYVVLSVRESGGAVAKKEMAEVMATITFEVTGDNSELYNKAEISLGDFEWQDNSQLNASGIFPGGTFPYYGTRKHIKVKAGDIVVFNSSVKTKYVYATYNTDKVFNDGYKFIDSGNVEILRIKADGYIRVSVRNSFDGTTPLTEEQAKQSVKIYSTAYNKIDLSSFSWDDGKVLTNWTTGYYGSATDTEPYCTMTTFVKVNKGDFISVTDANTQIRICEYSSNSWNSYTKGGDAFTPPYFYEVSADGYIRLSLRKCHTGSEYRPLSELKQIVKIYSSAVQD